MIRVKRVLTAVWAALRPLCHAVVSHLPVQLPVKRAVSPWLSHALWCGDVFVRSIDPRWKNPYQESFDRRRREREAREAAGWGSVPTAGDDGSGGGRAAGGGGNATEDGAAGNQPRAVPERPQDPGRGPHQFR